MTPNGLVPMCSLLAVHTGRGAPPLGGGQGSVRCYVPPFRTPFLDEVGNVGGQLLNHGVVEALDVLQHALVILADEVDGHALAAKAAGAANAVQVVLRLGGQVIVDDQGDLHGGEGEKQVREGRNRGDAIVKLTTHPSDTTRDTPSITVGL